MSNVEEKKCTIIDTNSGEEKEIDVSDLTKIITAINAEHPDKEDKTEKKPKEEKTEFEQLMESLDFVKRRDLYNFIQDMTDIYLLTKKTDSKSTTWVDLSFKFAVSNKVSVMCWIYNCKDTKAVTPGLLEIKFDIISVVDDMKHTITVRGSMDRAGCTQDELEEFEKAVKANLVSKNDRSTAVPFSISLPKFFKRK